jgi:frataxin-like iron-binding protein CyaY
MRAIEPGERFRVGYGNGHEIEVVALSGRQKHKLLSLISEMKQLETTPESAIRVYEIAEEMLLICVPDATDDLINKLNESQQIEIASATMNQHMLSEDDKKKSELPH